jgi:hypothetical protein
VLGLGAGTLATYGRQGDEMRMYEINEQVLDLARSDFSYLADSAARIVPVLGDGRLMLEREADPELRPAGDRRLFRGLDPDAPADDRSHAGLSAPHEADGILAVHITNRYLDLRPVVAAAAQQLGMTALVVDFEPDVRRALLPPLHHRESAHVTAGDEIHKRGQTSLSFINR